MAFIETPRFPDEIAAWLVGGRGFQTVVTETYGGNEYRNSAWSMARGEWDVSEALRTSPENHALSMQKLYAFFLVARGQLHGFRLKAPNDNADNGGGILGTTGLAVAATLAYQMYKLYSQSPVSYAQIVQKPVSGTISVYVNGVLKTAGSDYTIDYTTGVVTFASQPSVGAPLTWIGSYDIPVRFAGDMPRMGREQSGSLHSWQQLRLIEIRL